MMTSAEQSDLFVRFLSCHLLYFLSENKDVAIRLTLFHPILDSIEVSIPACHAGDPGSIPGRGDLLFKCSTITYHLRKVKLKKFAATISIQSSIV